MHRQLQRVFDGVFKTSRRRVAHYEYGKINAAASELHSLAHCRNTEIIDNIGAAFRYAYCAVTVGVGFDKTHYLDVFAQLTGSGGYIAPDRRLVYY